MQRSRELLWDGLLNVRDLGGHPTEDGGETIAIRSMVYLALSYDHRIVDGADAARFLTTMKQRLEEGAFEADLGL